MRNLIIPVLFLLAFVAGACDSNGSDEQDLDGTYTLRTVGGETLPVTIIEILEDKVEVTAGKVQLGPGNVFKGELTIRTTESGVVSTEVSADEGTFSQTGNSLRVTYGDGSTDTATVRDGTLTVTSDGLALVFQK